MKGVLSLFIMVDACGWEVIKGDPFAHTWAPFRKRLESVFGYSSTCIPSILSGRWPVEHRNWCYFVYDPEHSPFHALRALRWLPKRVTSRRIFRRWLTRCIKRSLNFRGYFDLYNLPFEHIDLYDFTEKKSPLRPRGLNQGPNIFDFLEKRHIPYFVSDPDMSEEFNRDALIEVVKGERIDFGFLYWPGLDGLMHFAGNDSPQVPSKLRLYEQWIKRIMEAVEDHYKETHLYIFSDHGMANCDEWLDLKAAVEKLPLVFGEDYAVVYDSTMARFWFFNDWSREVVAECLNGIPQGRILSEAELEQLHVLFPDRYFGELIYLVREGVLIVPSHMGEKPIRGMHGYHPSDPHSYAALMTNQEKVPYAVEHLPDLFRLMTCEAELALQTNRRFRSGGCPELGLEPAVTAYEKS